MNRLVEEADNIAPKQPQEGTAMRFGFRLLRSTEQHSVSRQIFALSETLLILHVHCDIKLSKVIS